jgi:hypothetical protein
MQKRRVLLKELRVFVAPLLDFHSNQTRGALPRHESAGPAVSGIKKLLVTPTHLQIRSGGFFHTISL